MPLLRELREQRKICGGRGYLLSSNQPSLCAIKIWKDKYSRLTLVDLNAVSHPNFFPLILWELPEGNHAGIIKDWVISSKVIDSLIRDPSYYWRKIYRSADSSVSTPGDAIRWSLIKRGVGVCMCRWDIIEKNIYVTSKHMGKSNFFFAILLMHNADSGGMS